MPDLWKWLMQANAKNAFILSLCVLAATLCGSAWLFATASADDAPAIVETPAKNTPPTSNIPASIGLIDFVNRQLNSEFAIPANPFMPSLIEDIKTFADRRANNQGADTGRWPPNWSNSGNTTSSGSTKSATVTSVQGATPAKPPPVTLAYKGFLTRADGVARAKISDSSTNTEGFYGEKDILAGATLVSVQHGFLVLRLPDNTEKTLPLHASVTFEK